jgi:hypothetical protein
MVRACAADRAGHEAEGRWLSRTPKSRHRYRDLVLSEKGPSTSAARLVALALSARMDAESLESFASEQLLAKLTALGERTVRRALAVLKAEGWIEERTKARGRDYWLKIRRAALPVTVAGTTSHEAATGATGGHDGLESEVPANLSGVPAKTDATGGQRQHEEAAMVADDPVPEIPNKDPGAASPAPAEAGSAALKQWSKDEAMVRDLYFNKQYKVHEILDFVRRRGLTKADVLGVIEEGR